MLGTIDEGLSILIFLNAAIKVMPLDPLGTSLRGATLNLTVVRMHRLIQTASLNFVKEFSLFVTV